MEKRVTLRDVAEEIGLSTATVSMALRHSAKLPPATRARVVKVAHEMGYKSDPMLSALASRRWIRHKVPVGSTLALLTDGQVEGLDGMTRQAASLGYHIEEFQIGDYADPRRLANVLYNRGILGVIVAQIFKPGFCAKFDWSRFVAVACSEGYERPPVHLVMPNHFKAVQEAWDRAWADGCRRIGLALFDMPLAIDYHERCAAFLERQRQASECDRIPICVVSVVTGTADERHLKTVRQLGAWMDRWKPDMVLGFNGYFYWLLRDAGWKAPRDVKFYDLWSHEGSQALTPGFFLSRSELGRRAVEYLVALIRSGERGLPPNPITLSINFTWNDGPAKRKTRPPNSVLRRVG